MKRDVLQKSLLVVGLARDCERTLFREVSRLEKLFLETSWKVDFYIVESDSSDATLEVLEKCTNEIQNFKYHSLGNLQNKIPERIERLRFCRNEYMSFLSSSKSNYDFIVVNDFDIKNNKLNAKAFFSVLTERFEWSALFANQSGKYFDIYALRHPEWNSRDCFAEAAELRLAGDVNYRHKAIWAKMKRISKSSPPIEVKSAFGGLAIYKSKDLLGLDYSLYPGVGLHESEHISLHYKLINCGCKLYIHPKLQNFAWNPHNLSSFKYFRMIDNKFNGRFLWRIRRFLRSAIS
jgi:hypothetical protein